MESKTNYFVYSKLNYKDRSSTYLSLSNHEKSQIYYPQILFIPEKHVSNNFL